MAATARPPRLRLLDPATAWTGGGCNITVHGTGFPIAPQSMMVRLHLPYVVQDVCVDVRSINESTAAFQLPDLTSILRSHVTTATVAIEIKATGVKTANALDMLLHPELPIKKISPTHMPLSATSYATIMLFLDLRYSHCFLKTKPNDDGGGHLTTAPVFVRISYVSENTKIPLSIVRPATWSASSQVNGDMLIEFQPPKTSVGVMSAEVSLNKAEFFGALCYNVWRDFELTAVKPKAVMISPTHAVEVALQGQHFLETGEVVVRVDQPPEDGVPQGMILNALCKSASEVVVSLPPKTHCGVTRWTISCNRGEHYCKQAVHCLLFRERVPLSMVPTGGSLTGGTTLHILMPRLDNDALDSLLLLTTVLQQLKVIRVRFQPEDHDVPAQVVWGTPTAEPHGIVCTTPAFDIRHIPNDETFPTTVSVSVDGRVYSGALTFHYFAPYIVKSLSLHHGPNTGGTRLRVQLNRHVPLLLPVLVKFSGVRAHIETTVVGTVVLMDGDATLLECTTPKWPVDKELQLTKVQVSLNDGVDYIPKDTTASMAVKFQTNLEVDETYLLFLFYPPPTINYIWPTSTCDVGGGLLRLKGLNVVDHGGTISVVFSCRGTHQRVRGFIEMDPTRHSDAAGRQKTLFCMAPPAPPGLVDVFVSLNGQQYSKCVFANIPQRSQFLYFKQPTITCLSPISSPSQVSTTLTIHGESFIDTGTIQVRFSYSKQTSIVESPHTVVQYATGRLTEDGAIECASPILKVIAPTITSTVEISLNSCDFTGPKFPFSFYRRHSIRLVEPVGMAIELHTSFKLFLTPKIVSDGLKVRLKVSYTARGVLCKSTVGPIVATAWTSEYIEFVSPALSSIVTAPDQLKHVSVEAALNNEHFLDIGDLLAFTVPYSIPKIERIWPVATPYECPTELHLFGSGFSIDHPTRVRLSIPGMTTGSMVTRVVDANFVSPEQVSVHCPQVSYFTPDHHVQLNWLSCKTLPTLADVQAEAEASRQLPKSRSRYMLRADSQKRQQNASRRRVAIGGMKVLPITMELATRFDQFSPISLQVAFYTTPSITHVGPRGGFTTGGAVVELQVDAAQLQYLQVVDVMPVMFGDVKVMGHRKGNTVAVVAPPLPSGQHLITIAFNQQCFEMVRVGMFPVYFEAFEPPVVHCPATEELIMSFGPIEGGTPVSIRGQGFVESAVTLVKFVFQSLPKAIHLQRAQPLLEYVVEATFIDGGLIKCVAPPVAAPGIANIQISCNGQQFSEDSQLYFEYHVATKLMLEPGSAKCGALDGGTPIIFHVLQGLPEDRSSLCCMVQLLDMEGHVQTVPAVFSDDRALAWPRISLVAPPWPRPTKVQLRLSLNNQVFYFDTELSFLYFDAPDAICAIAPVAGPVTGRTRVLVSCDSLLETGDILFKLTADGLELLVPGRVSKEDEAFEFETPAVGAVGQVRLQMSLNGVDFCAANTDITFEYYALPTLTSFYPLWGATDTETPLCVYGTNLKDYGAPVQVRFTPWRGHGGSVVDARVVANDTGNSWIECTTPANVETCFARLELSLNGQQFTTSEYPDPRIMSPLALHKVKPLYPFRFFVQPYFLASTYGSAGGGSRVVFCGGAKFSKVLAKCESKCYVQFTPVRLWGHANTTGKLPETMTVAAELDMAGITVTCRAPMFRLPCVATVDLLFNELRGVDVVALGMVKEKYHFYDAPAITEVSPSCGPMAGDTILMLLGLNIFESHQIHVRFQAVANRHEFCVVRGRVSTTLGDGTPAKSPVIQCVSPTVEVCDANKAPLPAAVARSRPVKTTMLAQAKPGRRKTQNADGGYKPRSLLPLQGLNKLLVNKTSLGNGESGFPFLDVMVDFSLNGGEQYLPRGVPFRFYTPLDLRHLVYGPHHVPASLLDELVGLDASPRPRRLVIRGFEATTLFESKCIGVRFEGAGLSEAHLQPCTPHADRGEVSCAIPEFAAPGTYKLLFSLNSQQFTYLGELSVHGAMTIKDSAPTHSPARGGSIVRLVCEVPASVGDLTLVSAFRRVVRQSVDPPDAGYFGSGNANPPTTWRPKRVHHVRVVVLAAQGTRDRSRALLAPVVTVRSRQKRWVLQQVTVNMATGGCDVDATLWNDDGVVVSVHLKPTYNTYRTLVMDPSVPTVAILTKYAPVPGLLHVVTPTDPTARAGEKSSSNMVHLLRHESCGAAPTPLPPATGFLAEVSQWRVEDGFFWLIATAPQVLLLSHEQTLLHCARPTCDSGPQLWVVGAVICRPDEPLAVVCVNRHVLSPSQALPELAESPLHPLSDLYTQEDAELHHPSDWALYSSTEHDAMLPLQLSVCFKLAGQVATASAPVLAARQIQAPTASGSTYEIVCALPPLPGKGRVLAWLGAHGICFSGPTSLVAYDPSTWAVQALAPPCGLVGTSTPLKLRGTGFLETGAIRVRFSTPSHAMELPGAVWVRQWVGVTIVGLTVAGRLSGPETNAWHSLAVQCEDGVLATTPAKRMLYQIKKDVGTLLWGEKLRFEVATGTTAPRLTLMLRTTSGGNDGESSNGAAHTPREVASLTLHPRALVHGETTSISAVLQNLEPTSSSRRQVDLQLLLETPVVETSTVVAEAPNVDAMAVLDVQVTSGQSPVTPANQALFQVYELPTITALVPAFLPHSTGGDVVLRGRGFFNSGMLLLRIYFLPPAFEYQNEPRSSVQAKLERLQVHALDSLDLPCAFVSTSEVTCTVPGRLKSRNFIFRLSFDHHTFTENVPEAIFHTFDLLAVHPPVGPTQGHTYLSLHGTNLSLCQLTGKEPLVRFTWYRGDKLLERAVYPAQLTSGNVYCYSPPCKTSLEQLRIEIEVGLSGADAQFTNDAIPYAYYRTPLVKSMTPKLNLVPGCTDVFIQIVENWENTSFLNSPMTTCRFRIKGQAQTVTTTHNATGVIQCRLPRFTVPIAVPQLLPNATTESRMLHKVWVRNSGLFVTVLRARNLRVLGSSAPSQLLRPFVLLNFEEQKLRSTLREFTANPQFNEQFDFELNTAEGHRHGDLVVTVQNEVDSGRNDTLGTLTLPFSTLSKAIKLRAWFPLQLAGPPPRPMTPILAQNSIREYLREPAVKDAPVNRGEIELFIHFQPMLLKRLKSPDGRRFSRLTSALKKTIHVETALRTRKISASKAADPTAIKALKGEAEEARQATLQRLLGRHPSSHVIPTEMIVELALNGQDYLSQCTAPYTVQPLPIIEDIQPKCLPSCGGSKLTIQGCNFIDTKSIKLAFLWGIDHYAELHQSFRNDADVCISVPFTVVDAVFESPTALFCVTPPTKRATNASFTVIVALNGVDFNSIFLAPPLQSVEPENELSYQNVMELWDQLLEPTSAIEANLPRHTWLIYETPTVHRIESASPLYTTKLLVHGEHFVPTDNGRAKFIHEPASAAETQLSEAIVPLRVISSTLLECFTPDFPPGSFVRVCIAMNGLDFIQMADVRLCVYNAPKIVSLVPAWAYSMGDHPLHIYGSNLAETGNIKVSFTLENVAYSTNVKAQCTDGVVTCIVPALHRIVPNDNLDLVGTTALVDVSLGKNGILEFTGQPLLLNLFHEQPLLDDVSPNDGPIWGGVQMKLRGRYLVDTPSLRVRFTRLQYDAETGAWGVSFDEPYTTLVPATYVNETELRCVTPVVNAEGPAAVQLTLNGIDFSPVHDRTWFVQWRNWKTRVHIVRQSMHHDGGARVAWQRYFEWKHRPKLNVYSTNNAVSSLKIQASHSPRPPAIPRRLENLPEIIRKVESLQQLHENSDGLADAMYVPPNIVWPSPDVDAYSKPRRLLDQLKLLYRTPATQSDIYSRLIFVFDNTAHLNAKYTDTAALPCTPAPPTPSAMPAVRRRARGGIDIAQLQQRSALCFHGLSEGLRWIFPHATDTELVELWVYLDPTKVGKVTLDALCNRLQTDARPASPEPGPMHYDPHPIPTKVPAPEMREPPPKPSPGPPQPFLDVGPVLDRLHPTSPRPSFPTAEVAVWCDPVYAGPGSEVAKPDIDLPALSQHLSQHPRPLDVRFAPLTEQEEALVLERQKPKPPAPSFGIATLKLKRSSPLHAKMQRSTRALTERFNASSRQLQLLSGILPEPVHRRESIKAPPPRRQTRLDSLGRSNEKKHLKEVKPVYLGILTAKAPIDNNPGSI
ncbi:hypothetical protein ACHHYP_15876 [Achlya hypogyna]|uniref:C2 domain-containing protein n=1 Tax=Achlya hypogyna TaxID=1202772 RepID=A0A1V9YA38_ACHHY|nr:hypothetical protein ACHHYP_15876 [Achlya hypogyna]